MSVFVFMHECLISLGHLLYKSEWNAQHLKLSISSSAFQVPHFRLRRKPMIAITGITGNIGSQLASDLLAAHQSVRAIIRDPRKGQTWADQGCEVAVADINDAVALATAFQGADAVFILVPPNFDPQPGYPEARATAAVLTSALESTRPK